MIFLLALMVYGNMAAEPGLQVELTGLRNDKGHVLASLYNSAAGYPDDPGKAFRNQKILIRNRKALLTFSSIPAGTYALAILHDENDDLKMNTNWIGLPKEGYGFSNNVMGTFGPPSFTKASFRYNGSTDSKISIRTRY
jgi:uncharacterized protein (DUF2141 family)